MRKYDDGELVSIVCNNCSRAVSGDVGMLSGHVKESYKEIKLKYGYGSELFDLHEVSFDLCEHCVKDIIDNFNIQAEVIEYDWLDGTVTEKNEDKMTKGIRTDSIIKTVEYEGILYGVEVDFLYESVDGDELKIDLVIYELKDNNSVLVYNGVIIQDGQVGSEDLIKNTVMKYIRRYRKVESQMKMFEEWNGEIK